MLDNENNGVTTKKLVSVVKKNGLGKGKKHIMTTMTTKKLKYNINNILGNTRKENARLKRLIRKIRVRA